MILTKNGVKPIEEIKIGDYVWTHKDRWKPVTEIGSKEAPVYDIKTTGMYSTIVTENHPYYTREVKRIHWLDGKSVNHRKLLEPKWTEVKDLDKSTYVSSPIIATEENPYNLTKEQCWILGRYVADGHLKNHKRKGRINSYAYGVVLSIGSNKLDYVKEKITSYHYTCHKHSQNVHRVIISNMELVNFIKEHDFGRGAENKNIPGMILNLPKDLAKEFLDGYLSGDAHFSEGSHTYSATTISRRLAFSLALLAQKVLNVNTSVSYVVPKPTKIIEGRVVNQKPQYIVLFKDCMKKQSHGIIDENKVWLPFKERSECLGVQTVYNFSVEDDESYVANNLVVHNCTKFSVCQKADRRETEPNSGEGWELFLNGVIAKEKFKPDFFMVENNHSISQAVKDEVSKYLGVPYMMIDAALVSGQSRKRVYWFNIPGVEQPKDMGITLQSCLDSGVVDREKSLCIARRYAGFNGSQDYLRRRYFGKSMGQAAFEDCTPEYQKELWKADDRKVYEDQKGRIRQLTPEEVERLFTMPVGYTEYGMDEDGNIFKIPDRWRYECSGNGWVANVIIHILSHIDLPKDYPIECLSLYDGIGTGRYVLDKLGYTNVTYHAYEIDKYAKGIAKKNYPDIVQYGNAFAVRNEDWKY